jgi:acetoin utilization deacetylase AcuC-like enzyme
VYDPKTLLHKPKGEWKDGRIIPAREDPRRVELIEMSLRERPEFEFVPPSEYPKTTLESAHDPEYLNFLSTIWSEWSERKFSSDEEIPDAVPLVFSVRNMRQMLPNAVDGKLAYYAMDVGSPIMAQTYVAAIAAARSALTAQEFVTKQGARCAFALTRPPGHHAAHDTFGGYCFINNAAVAAAGCLRDGAQRVAILDIDYHHGNGTQSIFYERNDVFVVNIHADPIDEYPFFLGAHDEIGKEAGEGFNLNLPMPPGTEREKYLDVLMFAVNQIRNYAPDVLVLSWGFDTYAEDPLSTFCLRTEDFHRVGKILASLKVPTIVVLEGGYAVDALGRNVLRGLEGLLEGC